MLISKELETTALIVLKDDLERMKRAKKEGYEGNLEDCIKVSERMISNFENGVLEIDDFELGYLDTVIFNCMPKDITEYRYFVNAMLELSKMCSKAIYPTSTLEEIEKGFSWAIEEGKGISVHIKLPDLEKEEIISNPIENLSKKLEYYKGAYNDNLELKTFNKIKIVAYSLD